MKNVIILLLVAASFTACKKYDEGPVLSLRSKEARVANKWKVEKYTFNGNDNTSLLANYTETYTKDGGYSFEAGSVTGSGKWELLNDKADIKRSGVSNQSSETLHILKLKEKEFWYTIQDGNDTEEFHLVPAN